MAVSSIAAGLRLRAWHSPDALRSAAPLWDDLWQRTDQAPPTARGETVAQWAETFAPRGAFWAVGVEDGGRLAAALPLAGRRLKGALPVGALTTCDWSRCGDLLLDPHGDDDVLDALVRGLADAPFPLLWFDYAPLGAARWQRLLEALRRAGLRFHRRARHQQGRVDVAGGWDGYYATRSPSHRRQLRKIGARLERSGAAQFERITHIDADGLRALLRAGFDLEHQGWKASGGTSVHSVPGMYAHYCRQAETFRRWGVLEVTCLRVAGQLAAFAYGFECQGVSLAIKQGWRAELARLAPGHALVYFDLRSRFAAGEAHVLDLGDVMTDWTARWATSSYDVGRLIVAPRRPWSRWLLRTLQALWPVAAGARRRLRRLRQ